MKSLVKRLVSIRIIRYGLVGGIGIPVNDGALFCFKFLFGHALSSNGILLYAISSACAFEVSNIVNFVLNQLFTYREQLKHIHGWEWVRRAAKGQLTSFSAMLLSYAVGLLLVGVFRVNDYVANPAGIIIAFVYNFFISNKLVFRPTISATPAAIEDAEETSIKTLKQIEATPKNA
jgi:putative flippase GtrA